MKINFIFNIISFSEIQDFVYFTSVTTAPTFSTSIRGGGGEDPDAPEPNELDDPDEPGKPDRPSGGGTIVDMVDGTFIIVVDPNFTSDHNKKK